jgi:VanZ family protein
VTSSPPLTRAGFGVALLVHLMVLYAPRAPATPGPVWIDKVVHITIFALVGVTAVLAGLPARPVWALLLAHAVVSELVQWAFLPGRSGDPLDSLADAGGVLLAWLLTRGDDPARGQP